MCFSKYNSHANKMLHSSVANLKACTYAQVTNYLIHNTHTAAVKGCTHPLNKSPPLSPPSHASSLLPPQAVFVLSISGQVQSGCGRFLGQRCLCNSCLGNFTLLFMSSPLLFLLPALFPFSPSVPLAPVRSLSITWFGCHSFSQPSPTCVIHFPPSGFD